MAKTWNQRLVDTMAQIRVDDGNAAADALQQILDSLSGPEKEALSTSLSLGWRFPVLGASTSSRTQTRVARLKASLPGSLEAAFKMAKSARGLEYPEIELKLLDPLVWYMGFLYGPHERSTTRTQFNYAVQHPGEWASSCGQVSGALKPIVSDAWTMRVDTDSGNAERPPATVWADIEALLDGAVTFLRFQVGCHSFVVESLGGRFRIYQAYMAVGFTGYNLAHSLSSQEAHDRNDFKRHFRNVICDHAGAGPASAAVLFEGTCNPYASRTGDRTVNVQVETADAPRTAEGMRDALTAAIDAKRAAWDDVLARTEAVRTYVWRMNPTWGAMPP